MRKKCVLDRLMVGCMETIFIAKNNYKRVYIAQLREKNKCYSCKSVNNIKSSWFIKCSGVLFVHRNFCINCKKEYRYEKL